MTRDDAPAPPTAPRAGPIVNPTDAAGRPALAALPDAPCVRIAVPHDVQALPLEERLAWRATTRDAFVAYLGRGYRIVAFQRGDDAVPARELPYYELARDAGPEHHA
jgi:predicted GNAT superfamily acetyltransferase